MLFVLKRPHKPAPVFSDPAYLLSYSLFLTPLSCVSIPLLYTSIFRFHWLWLLLFLLHLLSFFTCHLGIKRQCMWLSYLLLITAHCQPATHCWQVSTTNKMHMLIQLPNCNVKLSLHLSCSTWSYYDPLCADTTHGGVFVLRGGVIALIEQWMGRGDDG